MELRVLGYLTAIAEAGSISGAARVLHLTQPTLSRQLRDLERRLGVELFERVGRTLVPTTVGAALLRRTATVLAEAEAALDDVRLAAAGQVGHLTVGFTGSAINGTFGQALGHARRTLPRIDLRLVDLMDDVDLSVRLLDGRLDVVACRLPLSDARLTTTVWDTEPLSLFLPANHPLTRVGAELPVSALADVTLLMWPRETAPASYDEVLALCRQAGVVPRLGVRGRTVQTLLALVAAGFGATVMADSYRVLRRDGVTARRLAGTSTALHLVHRAGSTDPVLTSFLTALADARSAPATR